jgi:hypothetical protein
MPSLKVPGCDKTFSECPEAREFVLANHKTMSLRDMTVATQVAYHNIAQFMYKRGLMADRYTVKRRTIELALRMSPTELAYLAGVIDGEGTITITMKDHYARPAVTISNTSYLLRDWLRLRGYQPHMSLNSLGRWYWRISWCGMSLDKFLPLVRPYLVIKARHADLVLEFILLRRAQSKGEPPTARMLEIVSTFKWLNQRMLTCEERESRDARSISSLNITSTRSVI